MTVEKYALAGTVLNMLTTAWASGTTYDYNDVLTHNGVSYRAILPHTAAATSEPGIGATWASYWSVLLAGNAAIAATALTYMGAYSIGASYTANASLVSEAKSGYGKSLWLCKLSHTGATGKNPTGASGSTYWDEVVEGGVNGVSSLTTALDALPETTDAPVGGTDLLVMNDGGTWKKIKPDNYRKGYVMHQAVAAAITPHATVGPSDAVDFSYPTYGTTGKCMAFGYDAKRYAFFSYALPKSYTGGGIKAYIGAYSTGTSTNGVVWGVAAACVADGEVLDCLFGSVIEVADSCQGTAYKLLISPVMNNIVPSGTPAGDKHLIIRVYRDPANALDTLDENIYLMWVKLYVPVYLHSEA
jgi:hypothetical protein